MCARSTASVVHEERPDNPSVRRDVGVGDQRRRQDVVGCTGGALHGTERDKTRVAEVRGGE